MLNLRLLIALKALIMACLLSLSGVARAEGEMPSQNSLHSWGVVRAHTSLVKIEQGGGLSSFIRSERGKGFELQSGEWVSFYTWYRTDLPDLKLTFITHLDRHLGIIWGVGTGERGVKYRIEPSIQLGVSYSTYFSNNWLFSLKIVQRHGGRLREKPCMADYGQIENVLQSVNCRFAASELPPEETLRYLFNEKPPDRRGVIFLRISKSADFL